jgi:hypothetical protein
MTCHQVDNFEESSNPRLSMRGIRSQLMSLLTAREAQLVLSSAPRNLGELSAREVQMRLTRTRKLRDKYLGQVQRQQAETQGKRQPRRTRRTEGSRDTERKAALLDATFHRFAQRLTELQSAGSTGKSQGKGTGGLLKSAPSPVARRASSVSAASQRSTGAARKDQRFNLKRRNVHLSSAGRKQQARRDSR